MIEFYTTPMLVLYRSWQKYIFTFANGSFWMLVVLRDMQFHLTTGADENMIMGTYERKYKMLLQMIYG